MNLEYCVGLLRHNEHSHAIKAHRAKKQNPGLRISVAAGVVTWDLVGLQSGTIDPAEADDVDHLDFYIFRDSLVAQRGSLPTPTVAPGGGTLPTTYPWGTQGAGKPPIQPGTTQSRFAVTRASMKLATPQIKAETVDSSFLNIDFQLAPYPNPSRASKEQVHFGISAKWLIRADKRLKNNDALIEMSAATYADIYHTLMSV